MTKKLLRSSFGLLADQRGYSLFLPFFVYFLLIITVFGGGLYCWEKYAKRNYDDTILDMLKQDSLARVNSELNLSLEGRSKFKKIKGNIKLLGVENLEKWNKSLADNDTDKDGLSDYLEIAVYGTDPNLADTDGDSFLDGAEVSQGYNPMGNDRLSEEMVRRASGFNRRLEVYTKNICHQVDNYFNRPFGRSSESRDIFSFNNTADSELANEFTKYKNEDGPREALIWQKYFFSQGGAKNCPEIRNQIWRQLAMTADWGCSGLNLEDWEKKTGNEDLAPIFVKTNFPWLLAEGEQTFCLPQAGVATTTAEIATTSAIASIKPVSDSDVFYDEIKSIVAFQKITLGDAEKAQIFFVGNRLNQDWLVSLAGETREISKLTELEGRTGYKLITSNLDRSFDYRERHFSVEDKDANRSFLKDGEQIIDTCRHFGQILVVDGHLIYSCQQDKGFIVKDRPLD